MCVYFLIKCDMELDSNPGLHRSQRLLFSDIAPMSASGIFHPPICVHLDSLEATGMQIGHLAGAFFLPSRYPDGKNNNDHMNANT